MPQPFSIAPRGKVIRDPVHGLIELRPGDEFLMELIDTPEFQRLRRIRQLGVSSITFPGAEHTRFSHSLGVMNFATRILRHLRRRYAEHAEIVELIDAHEKTVRAAALLHDIGHGPFSHMIERADKALEKHEVRTVEMIADPDSEVYQVLEEHGLPHEDIRGIIDGTFPIRFLRDIVSSQLDADRMDYLLRDSLMAGVEYGRYDPEWIIHALCLGLEPDLNVPDELKHLRLCLDRLRGIHAAEQLVVARMHMSYQVYYHRVTRGWEAHLLCLFRVAAGLAHGGRLPQATPPAVAEFFRRSAKLAHRQFVSFDESVMVTAFHVWADALGDGNDLELGLLRDLSSSFLRREKRYFSDTESAAAPLETSFRRMRALDQAGAKEGIDYYHDDAKFRGYKDFGRSLVKDDPESTGSTLASEAIFLADGDPSKRAIPVEQDNRALITKALSHADPTPLNRLFIHHNLFEKN